MKLQMKDFLLHQSKRYMAKKPPTFIWIWPIPNNLQKAREQGELKSIMILKQGSHRLFKIHVHKDHWYYQWKACSQFLTSRPITWIQTQQEFSLKDMSNSKATKSSLKDSRTASASLTPTRLPKPLELQITSFTLAARASIPQARKKWNRNTWKRKWNLWHLRRQSNSTRQCNIFGFCFGLGEHGGRLGCQVEKQVLWLRHSQFPHLFS